MSRALVRIPKKELAARKVNRQVEWDPYPSQERFVLSEDRFQGFSGPVGTGKSMALAMRSILMAYINSGRTGTVTAPTYRMLEDTTTQSIMEFCVEKRIPHYYQKADNNLLLLEPMSTIRFRSTDDPLKLVGSNLAWFGMDELTYTKQDAWRRLQARLRDPRASFLTGFAVWTPNGHDWVWRDWIGPKKIKGFNAILAQPGENRAVLEKNPTYYEDMRLSYDEAFFRQEALGEYIGGGGAIPYHAFDQSLDVEPVKFDPRYPLCLSADFNIDPMCWVIGQRIPGNPDSIAVLQELHLRNANTRQAVEQFIRQTIGFTRQQRPLILEVYGDSTGTARDTTGELQGDYDIIFENLARYREYKVVNKVETNPAERSRIVAVNSAFCNAAGMRRITIDPSCTNLIADLEDCRWATDSHGKTLNYVDESNKLRGHMTSAFGYLVWGALRVLRAVGPQP